MSISMKPEGPRGDSQEAHALFDTSFSTPPAVARRMLDPSGIGALER
ncbi:MAG: hypothetical protein JNK72_12600 [Myxococcales bacterium]|nr:hypothetical protein [Myxococcales bacterium]